jgi:hypothetical protein
LGQAGQSSSGNAGQNPVTTTAEAAMTIEISKEARKEAIASIERYFRENMEEPIGNIAAGGLLGYFLEGKRLAVAS